MSEFTPRQTVKLLLEALSLPDHFSGVIKIVHGQNWGVRHVIADGKTYFIGKKYKKSLIPALKVIASPVLRSSGGTMTYRLHDGVSIDIKFESYEEQAEVKADLERNRNTFKISKVLFMSVMNKIVVNNWVKSIRRGKSNIPLNQLKTEYAKLA